MLHPYIINVFDIETYEENKKVIPYCLCVYFENNIYSFYGNNVIIDFLNKISVVSTKEKIEIYAHNLNFDGFLIIEEISKKYIKYTTFAQKTNLFSVTIKYSKKIIILKCSYKIIPISLKKLGKIENFPKTGFPYKFINKETIYYDGLKPSIFFWESYEDYKNYNSNNFNAEKETIRYCINDVMLTHKVLTNLFKVIDFEDIAIRKKAISAPSMSHKIFFKKYNFNKIDENLNLEFENFARLAFYGGRCETFGNIKKNEHIKYYDFSGMYGQMMMQKFHLGEPKFKIPNDFFLPGFYNITYESFDNNYIPLLPSHYNNKLMFTNGIKTDTFWFEEINLFKSENLGNILKINSALVYDGFDYVFTDFVEKFNEVKKKSGYYKIFAKLMINSLYGSMALKKDDTVQHITFSEDEFINILNCMNVENFYKINDCYIIIIINDYKFKKYLGIVKDNHEKSKRNVSYAAAISSKARILLYNTFKEVISDGGRLLYCDTDSIFAAYDKKNTEVKCINHDWLEFYENGVFIAPKTYAIKTNDKEIVKIKGIGVKEINFEELKKKFYNNEFITFHNQLNFYKSNYILKQHYTDKKIDTSSYNKRKFSEDKSDSAPFTINN